MLILIIYKTASLKNENQLEKSLAKYSKITHFTLPKGNKKELEENSFARQKEKNVLRLIYIFSQFTPILGENLVFITIYAKTFYSSRKNKEYIKFNMLIVNRNFGYVRFKDESINEVQLKLAVHG